MEKSDFAMPPQFCPACGYLVECASNMTGARAPAAGDISMCLACGLFLQFDREMRIEELPAEIFKTLDADTKETLFRMRLAWAALPDDARRKMRERGGRT